MNQTVQKLVDDFRRKHVHESRIAELQLDPLGKLPFDTDCDASQNFIPIDDQFLKSVWRGVDRSKKCFLRLGQEYDLSEPNVIQSADDDDHFVNRQDLKQLDDVCTRFCTKVFFPTAQERINMIANVVRIFDAVAKHSRIDYYIVFKGGVMLRLLLIEFLHDLDVEVCSEAVNYVSNTHGAVGVSDFDFEIVPKSRHLPQKFVFCMLHANFVTLLWLCDHFQKELRSEIKPTILNVEWDRAQGQETLKNMLQEEVNSLPKGHKLHGITLDYVHMEELERPTHLSKHRTRKGKRFTAPREHIYIYACSNGKVCVAPATHVFSELKIGHLTTNVQECGGALYATVNQFIGEQDEKKHEAHKSGLFHLARIKYAFSMYYTTPSGEKCIDRLSGEMVDLSQSNGMDTDIMHRHLFEEVAIPYKEYTILQFGMKIKSYSSEGFLHDIQSVLHHSSVPPWEVPKLPKRVLRYALLLVVLLCKDTSLTPMKRVDLIRRLARSLTTPENILDGHTLRTGNQIVDTVYDHERQSLRVHRASAAKSRKYLKTMSQHLLKMAELLQKHYSKESWSSVGLINDVHAEHSDDQLC